VCLETGVGAHFPGVFREYVHFLAPPASVLPSGELRTAGFLKVVMLIIFFFLCVLVVVKIVE
jgi:hypothetical protein